MDTEIPSGQPAEIGGWVEHLQGLVEFAQSEGFGLLKEQQIQIFGEYLRRVQEQALLQQQQQQLAQAAAQQQPQGQPGRPPEQLPENPNQQPAVQGSELLDETLPGAGGGAVQ